LATTVDTVDNKYECTADQELAGLLHIRAADVSFSLTTLCCVKWRHGSHLEILTSNQKIWLC